PSTRWNCQDLSVGPGLGVVDPRPPQLLANNVYEIYMLILCLLSEVSHPRRCAPPWWPPPVLTERTGRTGRTSPSGRTGRTHPSGTTGGTGRPGAQAGREEQAPTGTTGGTGPSGSTSRSGRKAPSERTGRTGRTYPSGIASR